MTEVTTNVEVELKRCTRGDECIHPDGPWLPKTNEYFYFDRRGYVSGKCKLCKRETVTRTYPNPERYRQTTREWKLKHPDRIRIYSRTRYNRKKSGGSYTWDELNARYVEQEGKCYYCKRFLGLEFHTDHKIPLVRGGANTIDNVVVACAECNGRKGRMTPEEYAEKLAKNN